MDTSLAITTHGVAFDDPLILETAIRAISLRSKIPISSDEAREIREQTEKQGFLALNLIGPNHHDPILVLRIKSGFALTTSEYEISKTGSYRGLLACDLSIFPPVKENMFAIDCELITSALCENAQDTLPFDTLKRLAVLEPENMARKIVQGECFSPEKGFFLAKHENPEESFIISCFLDGQIKTIGNWIKFAKFCSDITADREVIAGEFGAFNNHHPVPCLVIHLESREKIGDEVIPLFDERIVNAISIFMNRLTQNLKAH